MIQPAYNIIIYEIYNYCFHQLIRFLFSYLKIYQIDIEFVTYTKLTEALKYLYDK